jgi:hypothetical protein
MELISGDFLGYDREFQLGTTPILPKNHIHADRIIS